MDLPWLALGAGEPLVVLRWFAPEHSAKLSTGERPVLKALARHFRVHAVNRPPGLPSGITMAELAAQHAEALAGRFGRPVNVLGMSSGGSLALQLAADHPDAVRRMVVAGAACVLPEHTGRAQLRYTEAVAAGRRGAHHLAPLAGRNPLTRAFFAAMMWLADPAIRPADPMDMLRFAQAEDSFDVRGRLAGLRTPTLVVGGERDLAYSPELFRETADGLPNGKVLIYPGASHLGTFRHKRFASDVAAFLA
ncbi:Alpha/beta hydrolase family protein [Nonomuraea solani]|uniref:Alpha/beta hydrolase family protein n=1 Tax=Nonomuraea solani TaxID=1144553 RepID=A0A1H6EMZ9_9ACTN|nr:alpha/beta hydrolase [Nonomuraea solani]SEG99228.1 Alpha/beta hydrolase family protein [Nonomuraea solani]